MAESSGQPDTVDDSGSPAEDSCDDAPTEAIELAPPTTPTQSSAKVFGKYRLLAELGKGGMADVHLAVSAGPAGFSKLQVIKRLRPGIMDEEEMRLMMLDEARLAARLNHKNIVQTNEVGIVDEQYFLAMEYLDGQPYNRILKRAKELGRTIPLPFAVKILCEVLSGLHYAHEAKDYDGTPLGVVHRDVSPQNLFVTYDGQVKVVDFGIAKSTGRLVETQTGIIRGKITYMAPEQAFASTVDRRADIFSVGVLLWEAIAGERLWGHLSDPEIVARMLHEIPKVTTVKPDAPAGLVELCTRALARAPAKRPATAGEMRSEMEEYLALHDIQVNTEALGALVVDLFAEERDELHKMVDRELALLRAEADQLERSEISAGVRRPTDPMLRKNVDAKSQARRAGDAGDSSARPSPAGVRENTHLGSATPSAPPVAPRLPSTPPLSAAMHYAMSQRPKHPEPVVYIPPAPPTPFPDSNNSPTIPRASAFDPDELAAREASPPGALSSGSSSPAKPSSERFPPLDEERSSLRHPLVYVTAALLTAAVVVLLLRFGLAPSESGATPGGSATESATVAPPPPTATATATATASAAVSAQPDSNYVRIRITTNPIEGRILLDGSPLPPGSGPGPYEGKFVKDGAVHRLTVEAQGFFPLSKNVVFDKDQTVDFILHSKKGAAPR